MYLKNKTILYMWQYCFIKMNKYKNYISSEDWKALREHVLEERGLECERCKGTFQKKDLHIHHTNYDMEFSYENINDLMVVCRNCHNILHLDLECYEKRLHPIKNGETIIGYIDQARYKDVERNKRRFDNNTIKHQGQGNRDTSEKERIRGKVITKKDYEKYGVR